MRHDGSAAPLTSRTGPPRKRGMTISEPPLPPVVEQAGTSEAVREIFLQFERQAQRLRAILRLALVAVMVLAVLGGTRPVEWPPQFVLVGAYGVLAVVAAWMWIAHPNRARRVREVAPMAPVDIAAICVLQFLSTGGYLMLGLLAFLPFFTATQRGRRAAVMAILAIAGGAIAVLSDPVYRQLPALAIVTILTMLALLCLCSYGVSRTQERRLVSIAELTLSRSLLLADVMTAEERERRRIAEVLHDGALQTVLAARQDLREVLRDGRDGDSAEISRASELLGSVSHDLRQVTRELHPSVLDEAGLAAAVHTLVQAFADRTHVQVECDIDYPHRHRDDAVVYGLARELLSNVARHARADSVDVRLRDEGDIVTLDVRDDGVGVDPAVLSQRLSEGHIGLASHRARIETLRGTVEFRAVPQGTWVHVTLPVRPAEQDTDGSVAVGSQEVR
ncbi:MAG: sensor histidine kinase [Actinobacteria bacterium]|nr:sensor histidine kinase [Actinomycetota bacterium]